MKQFWVSWWQKNEYGAFEIHFPWWISGSRELNDNEDEHSICAAIKAKSEKDAKEFIYKSYDKRPDDLEFRFCTEFEGEPYSDRFQKADWMKWD